jgi:hypothetical protein
MLFMMLTTAHAQGVDPLDKPKQWPAGPLRDYFEKLQRPDNYNRPNTPDGPSRSCCGAGDVVKTRFRVEAGNNPDDVWYAWLQGKWGKDSARNNSTRLRTGRLGLSLHADTL